MATCIFAWSPLYVGVGWGEGGERERDRERDRERERGGEEKRKEVIFGTST